ncbi:hypothetical protein C8F04DRAFT_1174629 [Mycena alexandri]|uniref:Uncharacterized protein n=1 Tax=Mycena alexandri TaxID=1745969 RepID=A0AAD6TE88_9AGAR|nr:hypothetical protein C8F04DRAFT_1174629 [Mycena alexandri]
MPAGGRDPLIPPCAHENPHRLELPAAATPFSNLLKPDYPRESKRDSALSLPQQDSVSEQPRRRPSCSTCDDVRLNPARGSPSFSPSDRPVDHPSDCIRLPQPTNGIAANMWASQGDIARCAWSPPMCPSRTFSGLLLCLLLFAGYHGHTLIHCRDTQFDSEFRNRVWPLLSDYAFPAYIYANLRELREPPIITWLVGFFPKRRNRSALAAAPRISAPTQIFA